MVENRENFQQSWAQSPNLWSKIVKTSNKMVLNHRSHGRKSRKLPTKLSSITDAMVDNRENFQQNGAQLPIPWSKIVKTSNKIVLNHRSLGRKSRKFPKKLSSITDAIVENRENSNKVGLNHRCYGRKSRKFPTEWCSITEPMVENRENFQQSWAQSPIPWSKIAKTSNKVGLNHRCYGRKSRKFPTMLGSITDAMVDNRENFQQNGAQSPIPWSKIAKTSNKVGLNHRTYGRKSRKLPTKLGSIIEPMVENRENFQQSWAQSPIPWSKIERISDRVVLNDRCYGRKSRISDRVVLNDQCYGRTSRKFPTEWCSTTDPRSGRTL